MNEAGLVCRLVVALGVDCVVGLVVVIVVGRVAEDVGFGRLAVVIGRLIVDIVVDIIVFR